MMLVDSTTSTNTIHVRGHNNPRTIGQVIELTVKVKKPSKILKED